jgi:hypothetical protein
MGSAKWTAEMKPDAALDFHFFKIIFRIIWQLSFFTSVSVSVIYYGNNVFGGNKTGKTGLDLHNYCST